MKLFVVAVAMFSVAAWAQVPVAEPTPTRTAVAKSHHRLPVKRSQKVLARAAVKPGDMDDNDSGSDDFDIYVGYRKPEVVNKPVSPEPDELSDYIQIRLLVARLRALQKYQATWS